MKKECIVAVLITVCTNIFFAQEPVAYDIKFKTNDGVEYSISSNIAKTSKTAEAVLGDVDTPGLSEIPLPLVSSEQWEQIKPLFDPQAVVNNAVQEAVFSKWLDDLYLQDQNECGKKLVKLLEPIDYLDVKVRSETGNEIFHGADLLFERLKKIINESPDPVIELLKAGKYSIPDRFQNPLSQALLIAKKIIHSPFSFEELRNPEDRTISCLAWSSDGRLAFASKWGLWIRQINGSMLKVDTPGLQGFLSIDWSDEGKMAFVANTGSFLPGSQRCFIREVNGSMTPVHTKKMGDIYTAVWSPKGYLALGGKDVLYIRRPNGSILSVPIPGIGPFTSIGALADGRFALCRYQGVTFVEESGRVKDLFVQEIHRPYLCAWSSKGQLAFISDECGLFIREIDGSLEYQNPHLGVPFALAWALDGRLAIAGGNWNLRIRDPNGSIRSVDRPENKLQNFYYFRLLRWSREGNLAFSQVHGGDLSIYYDELPQEYRNLRLDQALLMIFLDRLKVPDQFTDEQYEVYMSLPAPIKKRFPLPEFIKRNRL